MLYRDPRNLLSSRLGEAAEPPAPPLRASAEAVQQAAIAQGRAFRALSLPLLSRGQRVQLRRAVLGGVPAFLRAFSQIVAGSPRLQKLLGTAPGYVADLGQIHTQLLRLLGHSERLHRCAEDSELVARARLCDELGRLLQAAASAADGGSAMHKRQAEQVLGLVGSYRARRERGEAARALRGQRRVARAMARKEALRRSGEPERLRREVLGEAAAEALPLPISGPDKAVRPRAVPEELSLPMEGAPLRSCLAAAPGDYRGCADELGARIEALGLVELEDEQRAELQGADDTDVAVAVLLADLLPSLPWLEEAAGVRGADLGASVDLLAALSTLKTATALLLRGSRDGALVAAELVLLLFDEAREALGAASDPEARELLQLLGGAYGSIERSQEAQDELLSRTERRVRRIESEIKAEEQRARYERVAARVAEGEEVALAELEEAAAFRRRLDRAAAPEARAPGAQKRKRPQ